MDAAVIIKQLLSAVNYMHQHNITHRDLKPENIVFSDDNFSKIEQATIKIIDFGMAEVTKPGEYLSAIVGSPYYVAPEVLTKKYNYKCDVWSCGVILYVLLCGFPPFRGKSH